MSYKQLNNPFAWFKILIKLITTWKYFMNFKFSYFYFSGLSKKINFIEAFASAIHVER